MKQRMKAKARKIVASILVAAMSVAIIPKITGTGTVFAAGSKNTDDTCLGTSGIAAPSAPGSGWNGSYVYYGTYDNTPIKFRVLAPSTTAYGGSTLFLDSDATLFDRRFDDDSNVWANSELRTYLNGTFLTGGSFTELEQGAIASSTVPAHDLVVGTGAGQVTWWTQGEFGQYVALNDDKIFVLDAEEAENIAYGYRSTDEWCSDREKRGSFSFWWLRSADTYLSADAGGVSNGGNPIHNNVSLDNGVAPALNINQSSIIFSSLISGSFNTKGAEYKLTIADDNLTIAVPAGQEVTASGTTITVPYQISGKDAGTATRVSVLILDKSYGTPGAQIFYYDALGGTFSNSAVATGTFKLPSTLDISGWGTNYYVYILAEDINGEKETDYASTPVPIDAPAGAVTTNYTVTYSVVNGTWADGTTADKTETVANGASPASVPTGMIAASDYTGGSWDTDPTTATVTADATFTYTFDAVTTYNVTVNSGTADVPTAAAGATVTITAGTAPAGKEFDKWEVVSGTIALAEATSSTTTFTMTAEDVEVTATYRDIPITTHTVTFNANGHGTAPTAQTIDDGNAATEPTAPTASGWTFGGWYTEAACANKFDFSTAITGDITLYAKWTEETPSTVYYTVVSGGNSTFTKGSAFDLVVTVKRREADETCFSHFTGVQSDGVALVSGTDYTAVAGSTVITIKAETLNNLSEGGHTITVLFDDGKTETSVTAKAAGTNNNSDSNGNNAIPATGESLAPTLFAGIAFIAVAGMLFAVILVQKKRKSVQR